MRSMVLRRIALNITLTGYKLICSIFPQSRNVQIAYVQLLDRYCNVRPNGRFSTKTKNIRAQFSKSNQCKPCQTIGRRLIPVLYGFLNLR